MILDLDKPQRETKVADPYAWADYIELLCMANADGEISIDDFLDRVADIDSVDSVENNGGLEAASYNDKWYQIGVNWFQHLSYREGVFEDFYPFKLDRSKKQLFFKAHPNAKQRFYLFLLAASNLRRIGNKGGVMSTLTSDFEVISREVMVRCLPSSAEVHIFGSSTTHRSLRYTGSELNKLQVLAADLRESVKPETTRPTSTGDSGLDLVGWIPMGDDAVGLPVVFGQCACTKKWVGKQRSISTDVWDSKLYVTAPPHRMVFIPLCFRNANGYWSKPDDVHRGTILIDRLRFVRLIECGYEKLLELPSAKIVNDILQEKEPLF